MRKSQKTVSKRRDHNVELITANSTFVIFPSAFRGIFSVHGGSSHTPQSEDSLFRQFSGDDSINSKRFLVMYLKAKKAFTEDGCKSSLGSSATSGGMSEISGMFNKTLE